MNSADMAFLVPNPDDLLALSVEEQGRLILNSQKKGKTAVLDREEARALIASIDTGSLTGCATGPLSD